MQVFKLDFSSSSLELPLAGQAVNAPERFHRLSWNAFALGSPEQEKFPVSPELSQSPSMHVCPLLLNTSKLTSCVSCSMV